MKEYRYALAPTSQFYFCGIPFRLDTSPKCTLNCQYCFAMSRGGRRTLINLIAKPRHINRIFEKAFNTNSDRIDVVGSLLRKKLPIHFGGMSDPFANQLVTSISLELFKILSEFDYPTVLSTKNSNAIIKSEIVSILKSLKYFIIQISITSSRYFSPIIEPNVPSIDNRIETLHLLNKEGFYTIVRLQPLFPGDINEVISEIIPQLGEAGVKHVVVEFLKLPVEKNISRILDLYKKIGWNGLEYYKKFNAIRTGREWVLPPKFKWEILQPVIEVIHKNGMTYGAGDYGLNHLGDTNCCCGIDVVEGFSNYSKANFSYIIKNCKNRILTFNEFDKLKISDKSIRMYMNSNCRISGLYSFYDYLKSKWNHPGTENAPDTFLGISWTGDLDVDGNCIYVNNFMK